MKKLFFLLLFLFSMQASTLTLNGVNYKQYTGSGNICPDGSSVVVYSSTKYCKSYRANISWGIPTTRVNGVVLPLSEIKGYKVYWTRSDNTNGVINIGAASQTKTYLDVYTPGIYSFAVSATDVKGLVSPLSSVVSVYLGN